MPGFPAAADLPTPSTAKSSTSSREPHVPPFARTTADILRFAALDMRKERQKHHSITKIQKHHIRATRQKHHSGARTENNTTAERKDKRTTAKRKDKGTTAWETLVGSSTKAACAAVTLGSRHTPLHEHGDSPDEEKRLECARCYRARAARCCRAWGARCCRARQCGDGACRCCRARAARCYRARPAHVVSRLS